ncbi:histone H3-like centromeric protein A [Ascaphus truei]|uniref:histone H3-like centromeric protein A n=1 Tax=Ascaphus truei TaxID=8439 RepID=UPI003F5A8A58
MMRPESSNPDLLKSGPRRERRFRPGKKALMEIRKYQKNGKLLIERAPFSRLVREICVKLKPQLELRWQAEALLALQEAAEAYIVSLFQDSGLCSAHSKGATLRVEDLKLCRRIRGERDA